MAQAARRDVQTSEYRNAEGQLVKTDSFYIDEQGKKVLHGPQVTWHGNGRKALEIEYLDGGRHGVQTQWDGFGHKVREGIWERGMRVGRWLEWYSSGEKRSECVYENGQIVGTQKFWSDDKLVREDRYEDGRLREITTWHDNGQKRMNGTLSVTKEVELFSPSPKDGKWTYWNNRGQVTAEGMWKDGKPWEGVCGVLAPGDAGSWGGIENFGRYKDGELVEKLKDPTRPPVAK